MLHRGADSHQWLADLLSDKGFVFLLNSASPRSYFAGSDPTPHGATQISCLEIMFWDGSPFDCPLTGTNGDSGLRLPSQGCISTSLQTDVSCSRLPTGGRFLLVSDRLGLAVFFIAVIFPSATPVEAFDVDSHFTFQLYFHSASR